MNTSFDPAAVAYQQAPTSFFSAPHQQHQHQHFYHQPHHNQPQQSTTHQHGISNHSAHEQHTTIPPQNLTMPPSRHSSSISIKSMSATGSTVAPLRRRQACHHNGGADRGYGKTQRSSDETCEQQSHNTSSLVCTVGSSVQSVQHQQRNDDEYSIHQQRTKRLRVDRAHQTTTSSSCQSYVGCNGTTSGSGGGDLHQHSTVSSTGSTGSSCCPQMIPFPFTPVPVVTTHGAGDDDDDGEYQQQAHYYIEASGHGTVSAGAGAHGARGCDYDADSDEPPTVPATTATSVNSSICNSDAAAAPTTAISSSAATATHCSDHPHSRSTTSCLSLRGSYSCIGLESYWDAPALYGCYFGEGPHM